MTVVDRLNELLEAERAGEVVNLECGVDLGARRPHPGDLDHAS